jgi:hypothetical protein
MMTKVLRWVFDQLDVCNRIAVDEQEVSERALLDHAELAWIGIALAGQRPQKRSPWRPGRTPNCWRALREPRGEQDIGASACRHGPSSAPEHVL